MLNGCRNIAPEIIPKLWKKPCKRHDYHVPVRRFADSSSVVLLPFADMFEYTWEAVDRYGLRRGVTLGFGLAAPFAVSSPWWMRVRPCTQGKYPVEERLSERKGA